MCNLAPIWLGCKCGETWHVSSRQEIDCDNDRVETFYYCTVCNGDLTGPKLINGLQDMHEVTEAERESEWYDDEEDWENDDYYDE